MRHVRQALQHWLAPVPVVCSLCGPGTCQGNFAFSRSWVHTVTESTHSQLEHLNVEACFETCDSQAHQQAQAGPVAGGVHCQAGAVQAKLHRQASLRALQKLLPCSGYGPCCRHRTSAHLMAVEQVALCIPAHLALSLLWHIAVSGDQADWHICLWTSIS